MDRESDEKKALTGMFKSLDPDYWKKSEIIEAYGEMIEQLSEQNFSTALRRRIFRKIKEYDDIGECPDINKVLNEFPENERSCVQKTLQTRGYPSAKDPMTTLKKRIEQLTRQD